MNETMNQEGDQRKRDAQTKRDPGSRPRAPTKRRKREEKRLVCGPPCITRGSALRPTPFLAPPFFEAFREVPRKGAFLNSDRLTPPIHQSWASCLAPSPSHQPRRKGGKNPHTSLELFFPRVLYTRILGPFPTWKGS